jgi:hypothetical protein
MNRTFLVTTLALLMVGTSFAQGKTPVPKPATFTGYLVDAMCAQSMVKQVPEKAMAKAKRHTRECNFHEGCAASGFGLMFNGTFHPFDTAGNAKAMSYLKSITQDNSIEVTITGTMINNVISVKKIETR